MALAIDITDGCGLNNKRHEFLSKKSKVMLYLLFFSPFNQLYITNKTEHSVLKVGLLQCMQRKRYKLIKLSAHFTIKTKDGD